MASEDQDILAKIGQLAGQINRHKNGQESDRLTSFNPPPRTRTYPSYAQPTAYTPRGGYSAGRGYTRGNRRLPQVHRHRTLVLNGSGSTDSTTNSDQESSTPPTSAWVAKTDRHMQLINTSVFEKDRESRAKAIEQTRLQRLKQKDEREKTRLSRHLQRTSTSSKSVDNHEVNVQGIRFRVVKNGNKLVKVPGDINAAKSTPKIHSIGGVRFHRSQNGNMYRAGIIRAHRHNSVVKKINEPCKIFTITGSCPKGPRCRYIHDPSKVAICKQFLQKGQCPSGDSCDLSHELTPERTPACLHFTKGNCSNPNCRYSHVRVSPTALVCRPFGVYGYCEKGSTCQERHVHECPDFSNTGICNTKGCKLPHRHKASVMRSNPLSDLSADGENSDISSDEDDEEIDSEDVDSDEFDEEFFRDDDGTMDSDIPTQQDYVQLK